MQNNIYCFRLCNGTHYWKRPKQIKCIHACSFKNSTSCCKSAQLNYSKNSISDLERRIQNIDTTSVEDSSEEDDDSCEDLDFRDRQSTQKLQTFIKSRALTKKINKKQLNVENRVVNRKSIPFIANKVVRTTGARSINNRLINNNFQKSFQQSSTTTTSSNTVGVSGGNIFLSIPEGYIANTVSTTTTRLLTEQEAIQLGLLDVMSTSDNKIYSSYQNDAYSNLLGNSNSRSTNGNNLLVNNANSNRYYQNINSQMSIDRLHNLNYMNSNSQEINKFTSMKNNNIMDNNDYESTKNYQNTMGRSYNLKNINVSHRFNQAKKTNNNMDYDNVEVNNDNNQKNQNSDIKCNYKNTKTSQQLNQHTTNNYNNYYDNNKNENNIINSSSQSDLVGKNTQSNFDSKNINQKTEVKNIKILGNQVDTTLKSDKSSSNESVDSNTSDNSSKQKLQSLNKHKINSIYKHNTESVVKTNKSVKNTSTEDNSNTDEDTNSSSIDVENVNESNNNSNQIKKQTVNIINKRNINIGNVQSKENTNTNKREINIQEINKSKTDQTNNKNVEIDMNNNTNDENISIENNSASSTHKTEHEVKKNYYKTYNGKNDEDEENNQIVDYDNEYDDVSIEEDDEVSTYEYMNSYRNFRFDSGLNVVGIIGEVLSQLDYQRYKIMDDNIYPQDCTRNIINEEEFHFIIVGGGNAGCVLANKLSQNNNWKILLIEAGGDALPITQIPGLWDRTLNTFTDWQYKIEPDYTTGFGIDGNMKIHKGLCLGGSSTTCAQQYVRGSEIIYNSLVEKGIKDWSYNTAETYFKKIEKIRSITKIEKNSTIYGQDGFIPVSKIRKTEVSILENVISSGFEHIGYKKVDINDKNTEVGFVSMQGIIKNGRAINTAKAYLSPIFRRKNLKVMKHARVTKVIIDKIKMSATGIEVQTKFGKTLILKASLEVLLCAGAIGTPKILLASGIGPDKHLSEMNVPIIKSLPVGENFLITPVFTGFVMSYDKPIVSNQSDEEIAFNYLARNSGLLSFPRGMNFGGFLNTGVSKSASADVEVHQFYIPKNSPSKLCQLKSMFGYSDNLLSVYAKLNNEHAFSIFTIALTNPKSHGKVLLRSTNPLENPIVIGNMLSDKDDVKTLLEAIKLLSKIENSDAMKLVNATLEGIYIDGCAKYDEKTDEHWECLLKYMVSTTSSTAGSCRMGLKTDSDAVVDSELNVIGISNLRIIGRSVMPMITSAYSHTPCIMIAERAYDIIQNKYNI